MKGLGGGLLGLGQKTQPAGWEMDEAERLPRHRARRFLALILIAAALIRLWDLSGMPPGLQFDEAHNAIDALRLWEGESADPLFFTDNGGREPMATWLHAPMLALVGPARPALALRLVSALVGLITILLVYGFVATVFEDRRLALLAAGFLATSFWHLHFSRYGLRAILAPLWTTASVWLWWIATRAGLEGLSGLRGDREVAGGSRTERVQRILARPPIPALACGACLAGAVYSHPTGRLLPLVLLGHALWRSWTNRSDSHELRRLWTNFALAGLSAFLLFVPLGLWFLEHPEWFLSHPGDVSLAAVAARDFGGSLSQALWHNALAIAGMFFVAGDPSTFHNLPGLPVFDPLTALLALAGLGIALGALAGPSASARDRAVLLALWLGVMLLPSLLSDRPPNYSRAIGALPVIVLFPALGLRWLVAVLDLRWSIDDRLGLPERRRIALMVGAILVAGLWTSWQYFVVFAQRTPQLYYSYEGDKQDAHDWLARQAETADVFLHPLWAEQSTIAYLNRDGPVHSLDATESLVLPAGGPPAGVSGGRVMLMPPGTRDLLVAFPAKEAEREGWAERFERNFGDLALREVVRDAKGNALLTGYRIRASGRKSGTNSGTASETDRPSGAMGDMRPPTEAHSLEPEIWLQARFGLDPYHPPIQLLGYSIGDAKAGQPLSITFVWRALFPEDPHTAPEGALPMDRDWTLFVQIVGPGGEHWGQIDRQPAGGSWPTSRWRPGDLVIDRYTPTLSEEAEGQIAVRIGWYDLATGERMQVRPDSATTPSLDDGTALELLPIRIDNKNE